MIELKPAINEVKLTLKSISSPINLGTVVEPVSGGSVPTDVRQAIYTLLDNAAYATTGLEDEIAIVQAWAQEVTALSISPNSLSLNNDTPQTIVATVVPSGSTVTWSSSDESVATVDGGVVTGVENGSCVITASSGNKSANCEVTVSGFATLESISAVYTQSGTVYDTDSLDSLKADLVVTGTYSDTSTATIPSTSYTLSGTLEVGTSTITVSYGGKTTTFNVTVTVDVLYSLQNTSMSKTTKIDTQIKLLENDSDFTILFDGIQSSSSGGTRLFICLQPASPWKGVYVGSTTSSGTGKLSVQWWTSEQLISVARSYVGRLRILYSHVSGSNKVNVRWKTSANDANFSLSESSWTSHSGDLTIGDSSNGWVGTLTKFELHNKILTTEEINNFFGA